MRNKFILLVLILSTSTSAALELLDVATLEKSFNDTKYYGSFMTGISYDGKEYWTVSGGDTERWSSTQIEKYDANGNRLVKAYIRLNLRSIVYNPANGNIYVKDFNTNSLYQVGNLSGMHYNYTIVPRFKNKFQNNDSKIAFSPDGKYIYDRYRGTIKKYEFATGNNLENITRDDEFPGTSPEELQIGIDGKYLFLANRTTIKVFTMNGTFVKFISGMPEFRDSLAAFSFTYTDDKIWIFNTDKLKNPNGAWEGYNIYKETQNPSNTPTFPNKGVAMLIILLTILVTYKASLKNHKT